MHRFVPPAIQDSAGARPICKAGSLTDPSVVIGNVLHLA